MWKPVSFTGIRNKSLTGKMCVVPFTQFQVHKGGEVANCCPSWLPTFVGNIKDHDFMELLQTPISKKIQESMLDSSFSYCVDTVCPKIANAIYGGDQRHSPIVDIATSFDHLRGTLNVREYYIYFNYDHSCNLQCPSCRNELILYNGENAELLEVHQHVVAKTIKLLETGSSVFLNITGSGDPFASPLYWDFLCNLDGTKYPNLSINLQTNGVLMDSKHWNKLTKIYKNIRCVQISVDASSKDVYHIVRRNGSFTKLRQNLDYLDTIAHSGIFHPKFSWITNFIVSTTNYHEIVSFAEWMLQYKTLSRVWYNMIADWGHLSSTDFDNLAIWKEDTLGHNAFLQLLKHSIFDEPRLDLGNMLHLREKSIND